MFLLLVVRIMKTQRNSKENKGGQGRATSDRAFSNQKEQIKSTGINNGCGQRSDQTSNRDNQRKRGE